MAVTKRPNHAATAVGCKIIVTLEENLPKFIRHNNSRIREEPNEKPEPDD
jgi:hypothetical protein